MTSTMSTRTPIALATTVGVAIALLISPPAPLTILWVRTVMVTRFWPV